MSKFDGAGDKFGLGRAFQKTKVGNPKVPAQDSQEKAKADRFRALRQVQGRKPSKQRSGQKVSASLVEQLRHSREHPIHPLWNYIPDDQRNLHELSVLRRRRIWAWLKQKRQRIGVVVLAYILMWSAPLLIGEPLMTVFAFLPLVLVPPVGYLVYWLVWKEFHD